jgi:hypothetical protein
VTLLQKPDFEKVRQKFLPLQANFLVLFCSMVAGLGRFSRNSSHFRVAKATNRPFYRGVSDALFVDSHTSAIFKWAGHTSTMVNYFFAGSQRIAMRRETSFRRQQHR